MNNNKLPLIREHQLQQLIMNYLSAKGWKVIRMQAGMVKSERGGMVRLGEVGMPDLMCFKKGDTYTAQYEGIMKLLFIEVKTPQNPKPTFMQTQKMKELEEHGGRCLVIHSLDELIEQL